MSDTKVDLKLPDTLLLTNDSIITVKKCSKELHEQGINELYTEDGYKITLQLEGKSLYQCVSYCGAKQYADFTNDADSDLNLTQESINEIVALNT